MKTKIILILLIQFFANGLNASAKDRETIVVLNIDVKRLSITPSELGQLTRYELDKLDSFNVVDKYELMQLVSRQKINLDECFSKTCMLEVAKASNSSYAISGSAERLQDKIFFNLRLINVNDPGNVKSTTIEFLPYTNQIQLMTRIALMNLLDMELPDDVVSQLTESGAINSGINNPYYHNLNLSGPRMGATFFTPQLAKNIHLNGLNDGQRTSPIMAQFGYQFEKAYITTGNWQALAEIIPLISGLESNRFVPNLTILNGLRNNNSGLEFAFGPTIDVSRTMDGQLDSRGIATISTALVFSVGKTIKSGEMNFPINAYLIPPKDGSSYRFGLSMGWNAAGKKRLFD